MVRRMVLRRVAFAACCVLLAVACTLFNPLGEYGPSGPKPDASMDAPPDRAEEGCHKTRWPDRPRVDVPGTAPGDLLFALETFDIGPPDAGDAGGAGTEGPDRRGFDLDGLCTCPEPPSCVGPPGSNIACDLDGGIDTAGTVALQGFIDRADLNVDINDNIRAGERGLLIRIRNYNGGLDDQSVELSAFLSGGNEGSEDGGTPKRPARDGNDHWTVDPTSLLGRGGPPYVPLFVDTLAYVSGGRVVGTVDFPLALSQVAVTLRGSVLTARLALEGTSYRLVDGMLVGRWATKDLLTALASVKDPLVKGGGLCGDSGVYKDLKDQICAAVDLVADTKRDRTSAPCDALGLTLSFSGGPAQFGNLFARPKDPGKCGPAWADDCETK